MSAQMHADAALTGESAPATKDKGPHDRIGGEATIARLGAFNGFGTMMFDENLDASREDDLEALLDAESCELLATREFLIISFSPF
jgi:hypothetical protein